MASISCQHIYKIYPGATAPSVTDFNLEIQDKEFIIFVGPSGCGKSTTLRMIAGLEEISKGEMYIGGRLINDVPPKDRDIAMVFQSYALYPHMTVYKNIAFGLELRKTPKDEIDKRVHEAAKILEIEHLLDRKPKALSGGQRQRVALGRAMVRNPAVFLLDGVWRPSATGLGTRPTVNGDGVTCETFIPDFSGDIYGDRVPVRFCRFLWPTQKFGTLEELSAMVGRAAQAAREWREK